MKKLVTFYSETHENMYNEFFIKSYNEILKDKYKLLTKKIEQLSPTGEWASKGFDIMMVEKVKWIIENIDIDDENILVYADCDIQFFGDITYNLGNNDIMFQSDYSNICAGFFICKQNQNVLNFFKLVETNLVNSLNGVIDDQLILNKILNSGYSKISKDILPTDKYWTVGFSTNGNVWNGQDIKVPNILMHHANFAIGLENKVKLLNLVKNKIKNNK